MYFGSLTAQSTTEKYCHNHLAFLKILEKTNLWVTRTKRWDTTERNIINKLQLLGGGLHHMSQCGISQCASSTPPSGKIKFKEPELYCFSTNCLLCESTSVTPSTFDENYKESNFAGMNLWKPVGIFFWLSVRCSTLVMDSAECCSKPGSLSSCPVFVCLLVCFLTRRVDQNKIKTQHTRETLSLKEESASSLC